MLDHPGQCTIRHSKLLAPNYSDFFCESTLILVFLSLLVVLLAPHMTVPFEEVLHKDVLCTEDGPLHHPDGRRLKSTNERVSVPDVTQWSKCVSSQPWTHYVWHMSLQHGELDIGLQCEAPALRVLVHQTLQGQRRSLVNSAQVMSSHCYKPIVGL